MAVSVDVHLPHRLLEVFFIIASTDDCAEQKRREQT